MALGKKFLFIGLVFLFISAGYGQIANYSNEFLKIGATARGNGMGNSIFTAATGAAAVFYNPANIANLSNPLDFTFTHSEYFNQAASYDFLAIAYNVNNLALGFGFIRLGIDNIPNTLYIYNNGTFDPEQITYFSASDNALFFTFSKKIDNIPGLAIGAKAKLIYRHLGKFANGFGLGIDLAATWNKPKYTLSAILRDVTSTFTLWFYDLNDTIINIFQNTGNTIPKTSVEIALPSLILAASKTAKISEHLELLGELSLITEFSGKSNYIISTGIFSSSPQLGLEFKYNKIFFVRLGLYNFQWVQFYGDSLQVERKLNAFPSFGLGFKYKSFYLDYSFQNFANQAVPLQSHFITLRYSLKQLPENNTSRRYRHRRRF